MKRLFRIGIACMLLAAAAQMLPGQEPRTELGARVAALKWLNDQHHIADTARVVADHDELWRRFVRCEQPEQRVGCSMIGDHPVTIVSVQLRTADTARVSLGDYLLMKTSCPLGRPLNPPVIGTTSSIDYELAYVSGAWRGMRMIGRVVC